MLVKIEREIRVEKDDEFELTFSNEIKEKVHSYWVEYTKDKEYYWDGEIIVASNVDVVNGIIKANQTKYSNLIYSKKHSDITIKPIYTAILLKTIDGKYIIRRDIHNRLGNIGGIADLKDFVKDKFIPELCLKRELKEETNLDLYNKEQIINFECKYLDIKDILKSYVPIGFIFTGNLNYTSEEFKTYMQNIKTDGEIKECIFCTPEECLTIEKQEDELTFLKEFINYEENIS